MKQLIATVLSFMMLGAACTKRNTKPPDTGDRVISRRMVLAFTDTNGTNIVGAHRKYGIYEVKSSESDNPNQFFFGGWKEDANGAWIDYSYFTHLVHPGTQFSSFRFETYHYFQFPGNDIDTFLYQKLTEHETKFFYNGRLVGTHPAADTNVFKLSVVKSN